MFVYKLHRCSNVLFVSFRMMRKQCLQSGYDVVFLFWQLSPASSGLRMRLEQISRAKKTSDA